MLPNGQAGLEREQIAITTGDGWKLIVVGPDIRRPGGCATPQHRVELYQLSNDPLEKNNLAATEPERVKTIAGKLVEFRKSEPVNRPVWLNHPPAGMVTIGAPSLPSVSVNEKTNIRNEKSDLDRRSRSSIQNQWPR